MRAQYPLHHGLEFMQALTPHFHWIAERERCGLWMVAKRVDLWLNRVFDTAEDFRLRGALPALLRALRALHPDAWEACLHVNTSPIPRFMGGVEDAILDRGLGPIGTHQLPADLWDAVVPPFYRGGLQDFDVEREWQDGDRVVRGATRWVSQQVQRIVQALRGAGVYKETADPPPHVLPLRHPQVLREGILDLELRQDQQIWHPSVDGLYSVQTPLPLTAFLPRKGPQCFQLFPPTNRQST